MSFLNPISPIQVGGQSSVSRIHTFGTTFSNNVVGGYMQVNYLTDLIYTIPTGTTGSIEYSGNTIPINFLKGTGSLWSPDVLTLNSDNLSSGRRKIGMLVYVREQDQVYQYTNDSFTTLWDSATAATGTVVISDFGTTVNNSTVAGQNFINSWTASTIDGYNGVVRSNAIWKKYYGNTISLTGASFNSGTGTLTLTNITGGTQSLTGFGSGGGGGTSITGGTFDPTTLELDLNSTGSTITINNVTGLYISAGTYSSSTSTILLYNSTGGTVNITGITSSGFSGDYLPLSGGTMTGGLVANSGVTANTISETSYIDFKTGSTNPSSVAGRLFFDSTQKALSYFDIDNNQVPIAMGQQLYTRVWNATGAQIDKGKVIAITGTTNSLPSAILARNVHAITSARPIGLAAENIPNGSEGLVLNNGILSGITLNTFANGDTLYLSDTVPGEYVSTTTSLAFTARTNEIGYVLQTGTTTGKIYVNINNEDSNLSLTDKERNILEGNVISSGVYEYTGMTIGTGATINVAMARGWIVKNTYEFATLPDVTNVYYTGGTNITLTNLATADATFILINSASTLTQQTTFPTPQQRRENILLGKVVHPTRNSITSINQTVDFDVSPMAALRDLWTPLKLINQGIIVSPHSTTLEINTSSGTLWGNGIGWTTNQQNPDSIVISGTSPTTFQYRTRLGPLTGGSVTTGNTTTIAPGYYDLNGVVTAVGGGSNSSTNQRVFLFPTGLVRIQLGQTVYGTLAAAVAGAQTEQFTEYALNRENGILIGIISVNKNATNLSLAAQAVFNLVSKFGEVLGGTGGLSTTTLQQAYDNSSEPEILINSTLDGLSIRNGTGNADNVTQLLQGQNTAGSVTSFIRADGAISGTSISATTISATTYQNLPPIYQLTGGTYSTGTIDFKNTTGGTSFNVTGFTKYFVTGSTPTGYTLVDGDRWFDTNSAIELVWITDGDGSQWIQPTQGGGGSSTGDYLPLSGGTVTGGTIFTAGLTANTISATTYQNLPGSSSSNCFTTFYTSSISGCSPITILSPLYVTQGINITGGTILNGLSANTISATTYQNLPFSGTVGGTGTSNFVTKWGNGIDIADSLIYDDSSFVGINTTAPIYSELISFQTSNRGITIDGLYIQENTNGSLAFATGFDYNSWGTAGGEIAIGTRGPLKHSNGSGNIGIGDKALESNTTGTNNIAIGGTGALTYNLTGSDNIAIGNSSLLFNDDGLQNVAIGNGALFNNITGDRNTVLGNDAGYSNLSDYNVYIGHGAGYSNNGSNNIFIGYSAGGGDTSSSNKLNIGDTIIGDLVSKSISVPTISATTYQNLPSSVGGVGTTDYIPLWTGSTEIGNSIMYQSATNPGFTNIVTIDGVAAGNGVFLDINTANQNFSGSRFKITGTTYFQIGTSNSPSINSFFIQSFTNTGSVVGYPFKIPNGTTRVIINEATDDNVSALNVNGRVRATTISATTYNNLPFSGTVTGSGTTRYIPSWSNSSNLNATIIYNGTDKIGINTSLPSATLHVSGDTIISSGLTATTISGNSLTLSNSASTISLNNTTRQQIRFFSGGTGAPTYNTYSAGAKIIFSDNISSISSGYAIGVDAGSLWYGADLTGNGHDWYAGTRKLASLVGSSGFQLIGLGGPGTSASMTISGTSALGSKGGTGYTDFLQVINNWSGATNPNKWFRVNSIGGFEILNSAYSAQIFSLTDTGILSVAGGNLATTSSSDGVTNYLMLGNNNTQIYDDGNTHIHSRAANQSMWINTNGGQLNLLTQSPLLGGSIGSGIAIATSTLNGYVTINTGRTVTTAASYGYLINSSSPTGQYNAGSQSLVISLYANNRIWGQEIDAFSDERMKNIHGEITLEEGIKLVKNLKPIKYNWKEGDDRGTKAGYSAQQVIKSGFDHLIGLIPTEGLEETIDEDGFLSPKDTQFAMNYDQVTPYHGVVIKHLLEKIEQLENRIKDLENR